jgi:hypothetical protein
MDFIDQHRGRFGVESICKVLPIPRRGTLRMWFVAETGYAQ